MSPAKELTHAVRKQQRALEERLEACLEELRRLCLREAVRAAELLGGAKSQGTDASPPTAALPGGAMWMEAPGGTPGPGEQEGQPWTWGGRRWQGSLGPGGHGPEGLLDSAPPRARPVRAARRDLVPPCRS